jgi:hypothetical protein
MTLYLIRLVDMAVPLTGRDWIKSEVYRRKVDTQDKLLDHIMDVFAHTKKVKRHSDEQHAMSSHECPVTDGGIFENVLY